MAVLFTLGPSPNRFFLGYGLDIWSDLRLSSAKRGRCVPAFCATPRVIFKEPQPIFCALAIMMR